MKKMGKAGGTGLVLSAIAAAGVYFLCGRRGRENREKIAGWTLELKGEVLKKMRQMKQINKEAYYTLVDEVAARYQRVGRAGESELRHLSEELKGAWAHILRQLK